MAAQKCFVCLTYYGSCVVAVSCIANMLIHIFKIRWPHRDALIPFKVGPLLIKEISILLSVFDLIIRLILIIYDVLQQIYCYILRVLLTYP